MDYIKKNQDAFTGGAITVVLGILGKAALKKEFVPTSNFRQILTTFLVVSVAGIGANEIKNKYPIE